VQKPIRFDKKVFTQVAFFPMQINFKRFSVIAAFALLLIVLIGNSLLTRRQVGAQNQSQARLSDTRQIILELEKSESLLKDAETGQRGFLYTGDPRYLTPYNQARTQIDSHLNELMQLTSAKPQEQSSIVELRALEQVKMSEIQQTIDLYQAGKVDDARGLVLSYYGLLTMERFRQTIDQVQKDEANLESARIAEYQKTERRTIASIYLASLLATVGLVLLAYYILREMDLREKHAREIREREEWFRVTLTSIGDAVIVTDQDGKISFLNPVAESLTGVTLANARGSDISEVFPIFNELTGSATQNPVMRVMVEGRVVGLANHTVLKHADGRLVPIEDSAAPIRDDKGCLIGVVLVFRDVTNERKSQELLRKTEKLNAAARLSASVAHEINNPLEAVSNFIYIAKASAGESPVVIHYLSLVEQELDRVAHITRQTLGFYRESNESRQIDFPALIESILRLYANKLNSKNILIEREVGGCPTILGVAGELKQVIANLVSNAMDAVSPNGRIRFRLRGVDDGNGGRVRLIIEDDGPGVSPENVDRIFEPFFTTKKEIGTGLGLWVTREIVERHGGTITVGSREEIDSLSGASFVIDLPCTPDREAEPPLADLPQSQDSARA
jgi:PAS domain S-box-containing protein